ncbi:MAG TPA: protein kinase, partial [Planctomycetota bacterium]|nr:protein kinase [Planctomycetota bacterium]
MRPPIPSGTAVAPGGRPSGQPAPADRATITRNFQKALEKDPFFSPLPELALARESTIEDGPEQTIFLMRDRRCDRMVVLKMLKGEKSEARSKRFLRETLILGRLSHPSIPPVLDLGTATNGQPFIVLPRTQGLAFDEQIAEAESPGALIATVARAAEAIAHAHSVGVVHGRITANTLKGEWVTGWESARDLTGKVEDVGERVTESTDIEALKDLVAHVGEKFQETGLLGLADKDYREVQALALDLRELLQASKAPEAPAPSGGGKGGLVASILLGIAFLAAAAAAVLLFLRSQNLDKDLASSRAELKKRDEADKKREASDKARALIADAQVKARAGDKESVKKLVKDA